MSDTGARRKSGSDRREARDQQERKEQKKVRLIAIVVVIVMVILFLAAFTINSKFIRRVVTVLTIDGVNFTAAEFDYYYNNAVFEYSSMISEQLGEDYAREYLPTGDRPHSSQIYDEETGETWAIFFGKIAIERLSELVSYHKDAERNGYVMTEETRQSVDDEINTLRMYAGDRSFDTFLQEYYGSAINEKLFRKIAEYIDMAAAYAEHVHDSFTYATPDLKAYYAENKDSLDIFSYRYYVMYPETLDEADFDSTEEYENAQEAALADTFALALEIAEGIDSEEAFIEAAREYNEDMYEDDDSTLRNNQGEALGDIYGPWLRDSQREYGDAYGFEMTSGAYVVFYISREDNSYSMVEMRQLLFLREETDEQDFYEYDELDPEDYYFDEEAYDQAVEMRDSIARGRAQDAYEAFLAGGATEEMLLGMIGDYSDDTTEGGFYDKISKYQYQNKLVPEIEEWLFEPGRQVGDYELIYTEAFGYHLIYFMGYGQQLCDHIADGRMRENDYNAWKENLPPPVSDEHWGMLLTQRRGRS